MAIMIAGMGPLYAGLFGVDLEKFFPHLALGIIFWTYFSSLVNEACTNLQSSVGYLKNAYFPISLFIWRSVARITIQFAHHIVIYIPIAIWFGIRPSETVISAIPLAVLLILINSQAVGITLGLLCTRFRDLTQIVASLMQLMMFLTPIFWLPEALPDRAKFLLYNPFAMLLDLTRGPLMGVEASMHAWNGMVVVTVINVSVAALIYKKMHRQLVYWL